ncbi:MAG: hypothetical protein JXA78_14085 [Anaerolineales bacterium]|nr:hypothetical protein [Anaerolineales bacterium]
MAWRRTLMEYEAHLYKVPLPRFFRVEKGEVEFKKYDDGESRLEIKFYGVKLPDGAAVSVTFDGNFVCQVQVQRGRGRLEASASSDQPVPDVTDGSVAEIQYNGQPLLRGVFRPD